MYYVYEWYIIDTDEIIYVGKGTRNRYRVRKHNKFFNEMISRFKCDSRIVKEFETEEEAFAYEFERVNEMKSIGQCVCNIYEGGFGGTVECWDDEKREKYAKNNVMKSERQRKRMSDQNPMKNKEVSEKVNAKKRIPVIINGKRYNSIKEVCNEYGVAPATVNSWCLKGEDRNGNPCNYADGLIVSYFHRNDGQKRAVIYKGHKYQSGTYMAKELGISQTAVSRWCRIGRDPYGNECRYEDDTRTSLDNTLKQKSTPIIVNGVYYKSKTEASKALGISAYLITQYLDKKKSDSSFVCEYADRRVLQK